MPETVSQVMRCGVWEAVHARSHLPTRHQTTHRAVGRGSAMLAHMEHSAEHGVLHRRHDSMTDMQQL